MGRHYEILETVKTPLRGIRSIIEAPDYKGNKVLYCIVSSDTFVEDDHFGKRWIVRVYDAVRCPDEELKYNHGDHYYIGQVYDDVITYFNCDTDEEAMGCHKNLVRSYIGNFEEAILHEQKRRHYAEQIDEALEIAMDQLADILVEHGEITLSDVAYTLGFDMERCPYTWTTTVWDPEKIIKGGSK